MIQSIPHPGRLKAFAGASDELALGIDNDDAADEGMVDVGVVPVLVPVLELLLLVSFKPRMKSIKMKLKTASFGEQSSANKHRIVSTWKW